MRHDIFKDEAKLFTDSFYCSWEAGAAAGGAAAGQAAGGSWLAANAGYIAAIASAVSTISQVQQASASAAQDKTLAAQTIEAARFEEHVERKRGESIAAKQYAQLTAAGFDPDSGTPAALIDDSAFNTQLNALQIRRQGEYDAQFLKTRAKRTKQAIPGMIFGGIAQIAGAGYGGYRNKPPRVTAGSGKP